ncbi:MAG TPA: 2-amino-4-hydroxy-6-hydroxymethyldihydropteridine diphosphokinase [bacterium]|nr:2-amino-4-hydroxy-6-hydroxymethyldihydropteridine diphosphokinase [bacterium]
MTLTAYVGLGSNIEPEANLRAAIALLEAEPGLRVTAVSPVYRTPPWGPVPQDPYLNAVLALETEFAPEDLLTRLLAIETRRGRDRSPQAVRWGPRTLDLDLLLCGDAVIATERLTLPHPRLAERAFVLVPLCDLAPDLRHPVLGRRMRELLSAVGRDGVEPVPLRLQASAPL